MNYIFFAATILVQILTLSLGRKLFDERGDYIKQKAAHISFQFLSIFLLLLICWGLFIGMHLNTAYIGMMIISLLANLLYVVILFFGSKNV